ncbi:hypothetical protein PAXRUDRAFT_161560 [Paxillus rubicundulus Ve08.2h10]|uniref:CST complex subunit STN1 n=1 Tax=Paxillus rubicundulus Ve08.2h10 TaxID=930991 RepID=A0A0D0CV30_9AGAM|nr:hypothetical protein PAXRUDRAFT_161560 [Paxillus rubicundulus Ve08.2h10]
MPSSTTQSPSAQDIWKWTLTREAIAPCFVRDVLAMRESSSIGLNAHAHPLALPEAADFFWLGYTPCRSVFLVGMVVSVQVYDKRTLYTIDDGTAVVDCVLRHPTPLKSKIETVSSQATASKKYQRPSPKKARIEHDNQITTPGPPGPPPLITEHGYSIRVVGKVVKRYDSRQVLAEWIEPCRSSLDEMAHWKRVIELHKTKYSLAIPFALPSPQAVTTSPPANSSKLQGGAGVLTSKASNSGPSSDSGGYRLPVACFPLQNRPPPSKPKLRHPSRLHTRDLTANTFRLYMKHYMHNAPPPSFPLATLSHVQSDDEGDDEGIVKTPTKRSRYHEDRDRGGRTPRPLINAGAGLPSDLPTLGFTLSHLRRVPELALLAARVVRAEARKREKVQREQERQKARPDSIVSHRTKPQADPRLPDPPHKKMKRLFAWAVVKLYEEGSIVLWDGDVRPLPLPVPPPSIALAVGGETSALWKTGDTTIASASHCSSRETGVDVDSSYLSDPQLNEEAYVPLTPRLLAGYVRVAVAAMIKLKLKARGAGGRTPTGIHIAAYLRRTDARWAKLGAWAVEEALEVLNEGH